MLCVEESVPGCYSIKCHISPVCKQSLCLLFRNRKKLEQVREKIKDVNVTEDKERRLKRELLDLERKVRDLNQIIIVNQVSL